MWTSEEQALKTADRHLLDLLGIPALRTDTHHFTSALEPERWSDGLAKNLVDVRYRGWELTAILFLETDVDADEVFEWTTRPPTVVGDPPPGATPVVDPERLVRVLDHVKGQHGGEHRVEGLIELPSDPGADECVFRGRLFEPAEREEVLIRLNGDNGLLMGWRHEGWFFAPGDPVGPSRSVDELQDQVEALPVFPQGYRAIDEWPSTDRPGHHEMLWGRYEKDEEVENDTLYASVNVHTGRAAECLVNRSDLDADLDFDAGAAMTAADPASAADFPGAVRCGAPRRMNVEIPGETVKPRAWIFNATDDSGPVQIALGCGGKLLRVDSIT